MLRDVTQPQRAGWLMKECGISGLFPFWGKRWVVVKDGALFYFKSDKPTARLRKAYNLAGGTTESSNSFLHFQVQSAPQGSVPLLLRTTSKLLCETWVQALRTSCQHAPVPSPNRGGSVVVRVPSPGRGGSMVVGHANGYSDGFSSVFHA